MKNKSKKKRPRPTDEELNEIENGNGDRLFPVLPPEHEMDYLHRLVFGYEDICEPIRDYIGK